MVSDWSSDVCSSDLVCPVLKEDYSDILSYSYSFFSLSLLGYGTKFKKNYSKWYGLPNKALKNTHQYSIPCNTSIGCYPLSINERITPWKSIFCKGEGIRCSPKAHPQNSQSYTIIHYFSYPREFVAQRSLKNPFEKSCLIPFLFSHGLICRIIGCIGCIKNIHVYIALVVYSIKELTRWERQPKFMSSCLLLLPVQLTANLKINAFNEIDTCRLCNILFCYIHNIAFTTLDL